ncbi:MAG: peptide ABC transporter substrate-binding protein [Gammaproteobacteria bacterium]|nr:peptide ABC transporter substrate-binding protein [Gammaproteobacteria bacterium]MYA66772.1 peptide ABC transporter substrate-binding protein [Gammaproteobacteria bacterium]MYC61000.1 peptide ABC transporter substrate-binding protein [Gammaproteobacteria bacterium]MYG97713.1 peptide ABC transporter substrate-binding protein [Gammaproteobacteria bacterium]MYH45057.1 peptide ABC transporter substrate-binding protein [Gammaproteobacteria bacterium]
MNPRLGTVNFSALRQLALYALYVVLGLMAAVWLLGLAANGTGSAVTGGAIDAENNAITFALRSEPPQLDYGRATDSTSITVLFHTMEGLLTYNDEMALIPGVAERWEIREDGATFWLREDARWSNGEPVTAHDFVFAWRRVQDPATASAYAFIMYPVKNAEAINRGDLPRETLGVRAVGDRILEVEFEQPTPYFDKLVAFVTFYPVNEAFFESADGRFGADADMLLYNGPYLMTEWVHSASMRWERNPDYWGEHKGFIDTINVGYITDDVNARLNLFKDGQIADTQLTPQMLGEAMERRWQIDRSMDGTVFFLQLNFREDRITANRNFRKALLLAQDPVEFVYKALKEPSYMPAVSLFPYWIRGAEDYFRQEHPPIPHEYNVARAREHLELARQELGLEEFPPIHLLADDSPLGSISSEYFQAVYARNLGLEMRIDKQIFKQRLAKMDAGDFDIVVSGWGPDYDDALTFGDLFSSWNLNNRGRYSSPEMDALIRIAQSELDPVRRMEAFAEIQDLVHEDVVIVPMYERGWSFVVDPRLKGFKRRSVGPEVDYTYAWIDDQAAD